MACGVCGKRNRAGAAHCHACGAALPALARRGERRQVTALFCDLVDSVPLTARLDPEDMMQVVETYLAACDQIITAHGGLIVQYMGDGVLAYFGYPEAHEDSAANAVHAALAVCEAVANLELPPDITLQVRAGVATGLVVIGDLQGSGTTRRAGIVGQTPNLAARLQGMAQPGHVLVAEATHRMTSGLFNYRALPPAPLKGFAGAIRCFEPSEAAAGASRFRARGEREAAPFVGRGRELESVLRAWNAARAGQGKVVLLAGEAGIGKSRLVEELRFHAADTAHAHATWHCGPRYTDSALHPVTEQLAQAAGLRRGDSAEARQDKIGRLLTQHGVTDGTERALVALLLGIRPAEGAVPAEMTPEKRKDVTLDVLLRLATHRRAPGQPVLLVLEDAHWCDSTTLALVERAVQRAASQPWLIVVTARPEFDAAWADAPHVAHIRPGRLAGGDAEQICGHFDTASLLPEIAVRQIVARCDGVPLFVEEMTRAVLEGMRAAPLAGEPARIVIPDSIHDSLLARLDRLGPARQIANLAAAIGRRFSDRLLAAISGQDEAALRQSLHALVQSGLVDGTFVTGESFFVFRHMLIRDTAYNSLLKQERQALHGSIATALLDQFPETADSEPELLAYHLTEAGLAAQAIPLWGLAGQRAAAGDAHVEAAAHLHTALALLRQLPADEARAGTELQLLIGLAVSLAASRGYSVQEVGETLAAARAICDAMGNVAELFAVVRNLCSFSIVACDLPNAEKTARTCLEIAARTGDPVHRMEADYAYGYIMSIRGEFAAAREYLERVVRLYDEHDGDRLSFPSPQDPLTGSLGALLFVLLAMGDAAGLDGVCAALEAHVAATGRMFDKVYRLSFLCGFEIARGHYALTEALADEALGLCAQHGYSTWGTHAKLYKAIAIGHQGRLEEGLELARSGIAESDRLGNLAARGFYLGEIAELQAQAGDMTTALRTIDSAIATTLRYGDHYVLAPLRIRRAAILARSGAAPDLCAKAAREAIETAEAQTAAGFIWLARSLLAEPALAN